MFDLHRFQDLSAGCALYKMKRLPYQLVRQPPVCLCFCSPLFYLFFLRIITAAVMLMTKTRIFGVAALCRMLGMVFTQAARFRALGKSRLRTEGEQHSAAEKQA